MVYVCFRSAKDRLALFEKKEPAPSAPGKGPKKIGKLNIGGKKEEAAPEKQKPTAKKEEKAEGEVKEEGGVKVETSESTGKAGEKIVVTKKTKTETLPNGDKETTITTETKTTTKDGKTSIKTQTEKKTEGKGVKEEKKEEEKSAATVGKPVVKKETKDGVEIETTESLEKNGDKIIVTKKTETKVQPNGDKKTTITTETKTTTKAGKTSIKTQTETKTEKKGEKKEEKKEACKEDK